VIFLLSTFPTTKKILKTARNKIQITGFHKRVGRYSFGFLVLWNFEGARHSDLFFPLNHSFDQKSGLVRTQISRQEYPKSLHSFSVLAGVSLCAMKMRI